MLHITKRHLTICKRQRSSFKIHSSLQQGSGSVLHLISSRKLTKKGQVEHCNVQREFFSLLE